MDPLGCLIADCLPPESRGVYSGSDPRLGAARELAARLSHPGGSEANSRR